MGKSRMGQSIPAVWAALATVLVMTACVHAPPATEDASASTPLAQNPEHRSAPAMSPAGGIAPSSSPSVASVAQQQEGATVPPDAQPVADAVQLTNPVDSSVVIERGQASWYGKRFHKRRTASGERFDMYAYTAAHRTLPFGTLVCVRGMAKGLTVLVRINDRGPHTQGRVIDLSYAAAKAINLIDKGIKDVEVFYPTEQGEKTCKAN